MRSGPGEVLDAETRWEIIARLLRDPAVDVADRVAGSFVLLYAQPLSRIAVMTVDAVNTTPSKVTVRFGAQDITVPPPLNDHRTALVATGRAHHQGIGIAAHKPLAVSRPPPRTAHHPRRARSRQPRRSQNDHALRPGSSIAPPSRDLRRRRVPCWRRPDDPAQLTVRKRRKASRTISDGVVAS